MVICVPPSPTERGPATCPFGLRQPMGAAAGQLSPPDLEGQNYVPARAVLDGQKILCAAFEKVQSQRPRVSAWRAAADN